MQIHHLDVEQLIAKLVEPKRKLVKQYSREDYVHPNDVIFNISKAKKKPMKTYLSKPHCPDPHLALQPDQ